MLDFKKGEELKKRLKKEGILTERVVEKFNVFKTNTQALSIINGYINLAKRIKRYAQICKERNLPVEINIQFNLKNIDAIDKKKIDRQFKLLESKTNLGKKIRGIQKQALPIKKSIQQKKKRRHTYQVENWLTKNSVYGIIYTNHPKY